MTTAFSKLEQPEPSNDNEFMSSFARLMVENGVVYNDVFATVLSAA